MKARVLLDAVYAPSDNVVARQIAGELIIVPLTADVGEGKDELYTLNETGRAIWSELDGKKTVRAVVQALSKKYNARARTIQKDVVGLLKELLKRKMVVKVAV